MMVPPRNRMWCAGLTGASEAGSRAPAPGPVVEGWAALGLRTGAREAASCAPTFNSPRREVDFTLSPPSPVSHSQRGFTLGPAYLTRGAKPPVLDGRRFRRKKGASGRE